MKAPYKYYQGKRVRFDPPDAEWLNHQYWESDRSSQEIADSVRTTRRTVLIWMENSGVRCRNLTERHAQHSVRMAGKHNPAYNGGGSRHYHYNVIRRSGRLRECEWCGATGKVQVHHIDHDTTNGRLENLLYLCFFCNRIEAGIWGLIEEKRAILERLGNKLTITFLNRRQ